MKRIIFISLLASTLLHADPDLLQQKDYDTLADCIIDTTTKEGVLKEKTVEKYRRTLKKNLPKICKAAELDVKITPENVKQFRNELNEHSHTILSFFKSELTVEQYAPINNCLQAIKNSIPEEKQLTLALVPLQKEQDEEVRSTLKDLKNKVDGLLTDTKLATTDAVTTLLTQTQNAVTEEATSFANEVKAATQELKQTFFESLVGSIAKFFGVQTAPVVTQQSTKKSPTNGTRINKRTGHRKHGTGQK